MDADETQIEASFCEAISIAREQKSVSLEKQHGMSWIAVEGDAAINSRGKYTSILACCYFSSPSALPTMGNPDKLGDSGPLS
jgi:hypothetical protein